MKFLWLCDLLDIHAWTRWSEPREVVTMKGLRYVTIQTRTCRRCNERRARLAR